MTYSVGDVFIGTVASAGGVRHPSSHPLVLHLDSDGSLLETLELPQTAAPAESIVTWGVTTAVDGRLYAWYVHHGGGCTGYLAYFNADSSFGAVIANPNADGTRTRLAALLAGDLVVYTGALTDDTLARYAPDGSLVAEYPPPITASGVMDLTTHPTNPEHLYVVQVDSDYHIYDFNMADGTWVELGPPPYDPMTESVRDFAAVIGHQVLIKETFPPDPWEVFIAQELNGVLDTEVGASGELLTIFDADLSYFADADLVPDGSAVWSLLSIDRTGGTGLSEIEWYLTDMPGGASSLVGTTTQESVCLYVQKCPPPPTVYTGLTIWLEPSSLTASDGDVIDPWTEAGAITIGGADDLAGDLAYSPTEAGTYQAAEVCGEPVIQYDAAHYAYKTTSRVGLAYGLTDPAIFNDLGQFSVAALGGIVSGTDTGADLTLINTDVIWVYLENFGDGTGQVNVRVNQNEAFQTVDFNWYPYTVGDLVLVVVRWDGTTVRATLNGTDEQTAAFSSPLQSTEVGAGAPIKAGFDSDPGDQVGQEVFLATWAHYLTNDEEHDLRTGYLACRYPCLDFGDGGGGPPMITLFPVVSMVG